MVPLKGYIGCRVWGGDTGIHWGVWAHEMFKVKLGDIWAIMGFQKPLLLVNTAGASQNSHCYNLLSQPRDISRTQQLGAADGLQSLLAVLSRSRFQGFRSMDLKKMRPDSDEGERLFSEQFPSNFLE